MIDTNQHNESIKYYFFNKINNKDRYKYLLIVNKHSNYAKCVVVH